MDAPLPQISTRSSPLPPRFPDMVVHKPYSEVLDLIERDHRVSSAYHNAKEETDVEAGIQWARKLISEDKINRLKQIADDQKPIILPVIGSEKPGGRLNMIPLAFAHVLQEETGLEVEASVVRRTSHNCKGMNPLHRLALRSSFSGPIEAGQKYIIVDDHIAFGGTVRNLIDYVQSHGGEVVAVSALSATDQAYNNPNLVPDDQLIKHIYRVYGPAFTKFHQDYFGLKGPLPDRITRENIRFTRGELRVIADYDGTIGRLRTEIGRIAATLDHPRGGENPESREGSVQENGHQNSGKGIVCPEPQAGNAPSPLTPKEERILRRMHLAAGRIHTHLTTHEQIGSRVASPSRVQPGTTHFGTVAASYPQPSPPPLP